MLLPLTNKAITMIFLLETYQYSVYSYNGVVVCEQFAFSSMALAEEYAKAKNLKITEDPEYDTDCSIEKLVIDGAIQK